MTTRHDLGDVYGLTPTQAAAFADAIDVWDALCLCADISTEHERAQQVILAEFAEDGVAWLPPGVFNELMAHQDARIYWDARRAQLMAVEWPNPLHDAREAGHALEGRVAG